MFFFFLNTFCFKVKVRLFVGFFFVWKGYSQEDDCLQEVKVIDMLVSTGIYSQTDLSVITTRQNFYPLSLSFIKTFFFPLISTLQASIISNHSAFLQHWYEPLWHLNDRRRSFVTALQVTWSVVLYYPVGLLIIEKIACLDCVVPASNSPWLQSDTFKWPIIGKSTFSRRTKNNRSPARVKLAPL